LLIAYCRAAFLWTDCPRCGYICPCRARVIWAKWVSNVIRISSRSNSINVTHLRPDQLRKHDTKTLPKAKRWLAQCKQACRSREYSRRLQRYALKSSTDLCYFPDIPSPHINSTTTKSQYTPCTDDRETRCRVQGRGCARIIDLRGLQHCMDG